jgi:hypothetical protein
MMIYTSFSLGTCCQRTIPNNTSWDVKFIYQVNWQLQDCHTQDLALSFPDAIPANFLLDLGLIVEQQNKPIPSIFL